MGEVAAPIRVVIADDERLMRAGLRLLIDGAHNIVVVAEAEDGEAAVALAIEYDADVVLMDVRMPHCDGIAATERLRDRCRVVVLTAFDDDTFLVQALRAGAVSFLLKDAPPEEVVGAVLDAAAGKSRFSSAALDRLVRLAAGDSPPASPKQVPEGITDREWEVALLVARGLSNADIAGQLYLGLPTVKTHVGRLFDKLHVSNRVQLAIRVLELNDDS